MKGWQKVYSTEHGYQADIVKAVLEEHNLQPVVVNKQDSAYVVFGYYEVRVNEHEVMDAMRIISNEINFK